MAQLQELLEKEELEEIVDLKNDLNQDDTGQVKKSNGNNSWIWIAAVIAVIMIYK